MCFWTLVWIGSGWFWSCCACPNLGNVPTTCTLRIIMKWSRWLHSFLDKARCSRHVNNTWVPRIKASGPPVVVFRPVGGIPWYTHHFPGFSCAFLLSIEGGISHWSTWELLSARPLRSTPRMWLREIDSVGKSFFGAFWAEAFSNRVVPIEMNDKRRKEAEGGGFATPISYHFPLSGRRTMKNLKKGGISKSSHFVAEVRYWFVF